MAAGGSNFNDFAENLLTKFRAVFRPAVGCRENDARRFARVTKHCYRLAETRTATHSCSTRKRTLHVYSLGVAAARHVRVVRVVCTAALLLL